MPNCIVLFSACDHSVIYSSRWQSEKCMVTSMVLHQFQTVLGAKWNLCSLLSVNRAWGCSPRAPQPVNQTHLAIISVRSCSGLPWNLLEKEFKVLNSDFKPYIYLNLFIVNWRTIALQYFVGLWYILTWIPQILMGILLFSASHDDVYEVRVQGSSQVRRQPRIPFFFSEPLIPHMEREVRSEKLYSHLL